MFDVEPDQFGASEGAGETQQKQSPVTQASGIFVAGRDKSLDVRCGQGGGTTGRLTVRPANPRQRLADRRVARVERVLGYPVRAGDRRHPPS
jgi:hypothetical protein